MNVCVQTLHADEYTVFFTMKILIIKLGALGDVIMATSLIDQILQHHRNTEAWLLTTPDYAGIFSAWNNLQLHCINRHGLLDSLKAVIWIRHNTFDRIYDLQSNDRTSLMCALSAVREIVGNHPRFPYTLHPHEPYHGQCHIYDRMLEVLRSAGIPAQAQPPKLVVSAAEREQVSQWLVQQQLQPGSFVIFHAGASRNHPEKCWPYFSELGKKLAAAGFRIVWVGASGDAERNRQLSAVTGIDATGIFNINALAELGRHARFAVTNDSGPMHVLSASGISVFALFGPTNWRRNHAIAQAENVMAASSGAGDCFLPASLSGISVEHALNKIRERKLL